MKPMAVENIESNIPSHNETSERKTNDHKTEKIHFSKILWIEEEQRNTIVISYKRPHISEDGYPK